MFMGMGGRGRGGGVVRRLGAGERERGFGILLFMTTGHHVACVDAMRRIERTFQTPLVDTHHRDSGAAGSATIADKATSSEETVEKVLTTTPSRLDGIQYLDQVAGTVRRRVAMVTRGELDG